MGMTISHIAFGGNLGNVRESFLSARKELNSTAGISVTASSRLYRTPPLGPAGQPDYLNAVIRIETSLEPMQLLDLLQSIENRHGRERRERWGARTLDLDIATWGNTAVESERLTLPHPHMHERMFVLCPLCDIDPAWQHPLLQVSAKALMGRLIDSGEAPLPEGEKW